MSTPLRRISLHVAIFSVRPDIGRRPTFKTQLGSSMPATTCIILQTKIRTRWRVIARRRPRSICSSTKSFEITFEDLENISESTSTELKKRKERYSRAISRQTRIPMVMQNPSSVLRLNRLYCDCLLHRNECADINHQVQLPAAQPSSGQSHACRDNCS
jgi:hypothetical protein